VQLANPRLALELYKPSEIADSLAQLYAERATAGQTADLQALIAAVSATLRNAGLGHLLEMIANDLYGRGLHELAVTMAGRRRDGRRVIPSHPCSPSLSSAASAITWRTAPPPRSWLGLGEWSGFSPKVVVTQIPA